MRERDSVGTFEELHEAATRATGLSDFGADEYHEGLHRLLDDLAASAALTGVGNAMMRGFVRGALVARLLAEDGFARHPSYVDVPIERPIFVTGLQRSGTTMLQRLLHADPAHQGLEMWLTQVPKPRPPRETWANDPVFTAIQDGFTKRHEENPEAAGIHYIAADTVEECWQLLQQSFLSVSFQTLAHVPTYASWLAKADWVPAYERHRRNLQLIGLNDAGKRWVLKNPSHLDALDALMGVYPDALVIQTHRDPAVCVASACSLSAETTRGWSTVFQGEVIGRATLDLLAEEAERFAKARRRYDAAQFLDVQYDDLVADPLGTVASVYEAFGLPWSDEARSHIEAAHTESLSGAAKPRHRYALADYGLTEAEVRARF